MNIPNNLLYSKEHEWIRIEGDEAYIGITEFAQHELGDVVFIEVETQGESLHSGEIFGTIEAVKTVSDLYLPVHAEVLEVNSKVLDQPELVNSDPYGEGWIIKVKITEESSTDSLLDSEAYQQIIMG